MTEEEKQEALKKAMERAIQAILDGKSVCWKPTIKKDADGLVSLYVEETFLLNYYNKDKLVIRDNSVSVEKDSPSFTVRGEG